MNENNDRRGISLNKNDYPEIYGRDDGEIYPSAPAEKEIYPMAEIYPAQKAEISPYTDYSPARPAISVPEEAMAAFAGYLFAGETVLWSGLGKPPKLSSAAIPIPFATFWTGFSIFWTILATTGGGAMGLFGVPFILIGLGMFAGIIKGFAPTRYAVTSKRILSLKGKDFKMEYIDRVSDARIYVRAAGKADVVCSFTASDGAAPIGASLTLEGLSQAEAETARRLIMSEAARERQQNK